MSKKKEKTAYEIPKWCGMPILDHEDGMGGCLGISYGYVKKEGEKYCKGCHCHFYKKEVEMLKPRINDIIRIDANHPAVIRSAEQLKTAKYAFQEAAEMLRTTGDIFWESVFETFPELKGFKLSFDHIKNELKVDSRKKED